jgi:hypothetical protein
MSRPILKSRISDYPSTFKILRPARISGSVKDAFDPRLRTHNLKGELSAYWAYSVNREYRILFRFVGSSEALIMMSALMKFIANIFFTTQISIFHVSGIPDTWKFIG